MRQCCRSAPDRGSPPVAAVWPRRRWVAVVGRRRFPSCSRRRRGGRAAPVPGATMGCADPCLPVSRVVPPLCHQASPTNGPVARPRGVLPGGLRVAPARSTAEPRREGHNHIPPVTPSGGATSGTGCVTEKPAFRRGAAGSRFKGSIRECSKASSGAGVASGSRFKGSMREDSKRHLGRALLPAHGSRTSHLLGSSGKVCHRLVFGPCYLRVASCSPPSRPLRAACGGGLRPSLTAAARAARAS